MKKVIIASKNPVKIQAVKNGFENLTGDIIDRTKYYTEAVILSLIPFKNTKLY